MQHARATTTIILVTGYFTPSVDDDEVDDTESEALAYLRGVCSICNTQVADSIGMCGLRDCCYECDYGLWFNMKHIRAVKTYVLSRVFICFYTSWNDVSLEDGKNRRVQPARVDRRSR